MTKRSEPVAIRLENCSNAHIEGNRAYGMPVLEMIDTENVNAVDNQAFTATNDLSGEYEAASNATTPSAEKITLRWLMDHVPIGWWWALIGILGSIIMATFFAGEMYANVRSAADVKDRLAKKAELDQVIAELSDKRHHLQSEVDRLVVERDIAKLSPGEIREKLKDWTK